jgi:phospholipase C
MSTCNQRVDETVIDCKARANDAYAACKARADEAISRCRQWADKGSSECTERAEQRRKNCCTWRPCSWACRAWVWVSEWTCKAWRWVSSRVCVGWFTFTKAACKVWEFTAESILCNVLSWPRRFGCFVGDTIRCWVSAALAPLRRARSRPRIEKVFVLMLENRSFDHMFAFAGLEGREATTGKRTVARVASPDVHFNSDPRSGERIFIRKPAQYAIPAKHKDPPHEFLDTYEQLCGPLGEGDDWSSRKGSYPAPDRILNEGFVAAAVRDGSERPENVMRCFSPDQVPVLTSLAREFAVCDAWFSSLPGPTWPNRFFVHAASSGGLDGSPSSFDSASSVAWDGYRFQNGTIFDRLDSRCMPWRVFEGDQTPQVWSISGMHLHALLGRFTNMDRFAAQVRQASFEPAYIFIEPSYGNFLVDFACGTSQHPLDDVSRGERLIKQVYEAIRNSPHWETSVLVVTYDEHGGFYDHVRPPAAVAPGDRITDKDNNQHGFDFRQLGPRVPAIVISPLIPRGTIDHTGYDHTSILASVERLFGLKPLTARDAAANDFLHLFSLSEPRTDTPTELPEPADSGLRCASIPLADGRDVVRLVGTDHSDASEQEFVRSGALPPSIEDAQPVPASLWGFMHVILRRSLAAIPLRARQERIRLVHAFSEVRTAGDARRFVHDAQRLTGGLSADSAGVGGVDMAPRQPRTD